MHPWLLIFIGFVLSVLGVVLPFLMVIHVIASTFFLNFFSAGAMITGLALGVAGGSMYVRQHRK